MKALSCFIFIMVLLGCRNRDLEVGLTKIYNYQDTSINIVIKEKTKLGKKVTLIDVDGLTSYIDTGACLNNNYALFEKGDTVIKQKGAFYIKIKKHDKIYLINIGCDTSYLDSVLLH